MPTARFGLGLAPAGDGKLYAIGGMTEVGSVATSTAVEAFDPSTQSWSERASMPIALSNLGVAEGSDGRIYALGEIPATPTWIPQLEIYDPSANAWSVTSTPSNAFSLTYYPMVVAGEDGRIYAFGVTSAAYSPATNTWTAIRPMPNNTEFGDYSYLTFESAALGGDGRIYLFPDVEMSAQGTTVAAYNPRVDDWIPHASMPTSRTFPAAVTTIDGRVFVVGGMRDTDPAGAVEEYLPASDSWVQHSSLTTPRGYLGAAVTTANRILAIGGLGTNWVPTSAVEEYDPTTDVWTSRAPLPMTLFSSGVASGSDGKIYVAGGATSQTSPSTSAMEVYDPSTNVWSAGPCMLEAVSNFSLVATPDSKLYAIGGSNSGGYSSAVQVYDLSTKHWSPRSSLLPPARLVISVLGSDGRIYAIGGTVTGASYATRVDVYDPATDRWSPSATLPIGTAFAAATADGSDIFIAGGIAYSGGLGAMLEHGCLCPWPATGLVSRPASRATPLVTRRQSPTSPPATIHPSRGQVFVTATAGNR